MLPIFVSMIWELNLTGGFYEKEICIHAFGGCPDGMRFFPASIRCCMRPRHYIGGWNMKSKKKIKVFDLVNYIVFILIGLAAGHRKGMVLK